MLLEGDATDAVSSLKGELPSDLLVYGCGELARSLLAATLVDEFASGFILPSGAPGTRPFQGEAQDRLRAARLGNVRLGCDTAPLRAGLADRRVERLSEIPARPRSTCAGRLREQAVVRLVPRA